MLQKICHVNLLQSKALSDPNNVTSYYRTQKYTHFATILSYLINCTHHLNFYFTIHCLSCKTVRLFGSVQKFLFILIQELIFYILYIPFLSHNKLSILHYI